MGSKNKSLIIVLLCILMLLGNIVLFSVIPDAKTIFVDEIVVKLINAIQYGKSAEAEQLIKDGVDINFKNKQGVTPLYYFFLKKDYTSFKKLLEMGADTNVHPDGLGMFKLIDFSMMTTDDRYFKLLLEYKVDLEYIPEQGPSLLESALSETVNIKYLKMLLEHRIKPLISTFWSDNPVYIALGHREYKRVILLLDYYPDYLKDEKVKNLVIKHLGEDKNFSNTQWLKDQQMLVKYLKDKFNIEVIMKYPDGVKK